jgi:hypothetical protein
MSDDQRRELLHLDITTRTGAWSYRTPRALPMALVRSGYAAADPERADFYRITPAGIAALADGEPSTVRAWCDGCGVVTIHHCLYDHATGERFACAGCAERIAS